MVKNVERSDLQHYGEEFPIAMKFIGGAINSIEFHQRAPSTNPKVNDELLARAREWVNQTVLAEVGLQRTLQGKLTFKIYPPIAHATNGAIPCFEFRCPCGTTTITCHEPIVFYDGRESWQPVKQSTKGDDIPAW